MPTFSINTPIYLFEEGKWLLAVTNFAGTNSVFSITDENSNTTTPGQRTPERGGKIIDNLNKLMELRFENDIQLHVKEVEKTLEYE